jgi:hypothetical protein
LLHHGCFFLANHHSHLTSLSRLPSSRRHSLSLSLSLISLTNLNIALIAGFVPFRSFVINHLFDENDLLYLDPVTETDADFITDLIDYDEAITPKRTSEFGLGLSEFRILGVPHDADEYYEKHPENIDRYSSIGSSRSLNVSNSLCGSDIGGGSDRDDRSHKSCTF